MNIPVVLFVYNRVDHLKLCIESLQKNQEAYNTCLIIFSDGPKLNDSDSVLNVRNYLKKITGFRSIEIIESEVNQGLSQSIITGVTAVLNRYDSAIILEDDLIVSPYFLEYMMYYLNLYQYNSNVASIHGYLYPIAVSLQTPFFIRGADCWGWGTWKRAWPYFNPNGSDLLFLLTSKALTKDFNFNDNYPYSKMLQDQVLGKNDSWAIRWYASAYLNNMLTLYPNKSLIMNIGNDGTGSHCTENDNFNVTLCNQPVFLGNLPIVESIDGKKAFQNFYRNIYGGKIDRLRRKLSKYFLGRIN